MAKYKVLVPYNDLEKKKTFTVNDEVEMNVKRADEVNTGLAKYGTILERINNKETDEVDEVETTEEVEETEEAETVEETE